MAKTLAIIFGIVLVLIGVAAFVSNPFFGAGAIFDTNHLHDGVHIVLGLILLVVAFAAARASALWMKIVGIVLLLVAVLGFLIVPNGGDLFGATTNLADHLLHVVLGVVLLVAGFVATDGKAMPAARPSAPAPAPTPASAPAPAASDMGTSSM